MRPDDEGTARTGAAPDARVRAERAGSVGAGVGGAELQDYSTMSRRQRLLEA